MDQELVQYLEEKFQTQEQRFQSLLDQSLGGIAARFESGNARFDPVEQRLDAHDDRFEEVKRHTGVLVEGLRHEIQQVAEGLVMHIEFRHREDREYFDRKFEDMSSLFRSSHDHLQQQHDQLRQSQDQIHQRVENLDRNQN